MSCLYNSLSSFHRDISTNQLRQILCNYLSTDPILGGMSASDNIKYDNTLNVTLRDYINRMRNNSEWGGAIEIKAYCDLYNRNVTVWSIPNRKNIEFLSDKKSNIIDKIYWTGSHFEPVSSSTIDNAYSEKPVNNITKQQTNIPNNNNNRYRNTARYNLRPMARNNNVPCNCANCLKRRYLNYYN